jgi:hypothetical protein
LEANFHITSILGLRVRANQKMVPTLPSFHEHLIIYSIPIEIGVVGAGRWIT